MLSIFYLIIVQLDLARYKKKSRTNILIHTLCPLPPRKNIKHFAAAVLYSIDVRIFNSTRVFVLLTSFKIVKYFAFQLNCFV